MTSTSNQHPESDRRRSDWQLNDRRRAWPWVMDINDRRSGFDRRVEERRAEERRDSH